MLPLRMDKPDPGPSSIEGIKETIIEKIKSGIPYLGICLGLEVLYDSSEEEINESEKEIPYSDIKVIEETYKIIIRIYFKY